ncbi:MAG: Fe-S-containing hydro-lyase [Candidatus Zophobacter franzmannii]|jgi:fumarate hydratase subunit beta|nr:Fe-S-containing hydro-lyase [Candidatus Zophobacter franzmannii]
MPIQIQLPFTEEDALKLKVGDEVLLSGVIYTARDAAHKKIVELIDKGMKLPFYLQDSVIYYTGPSPAKPNEVIGSAGPTTSYRMDAYTPTLLRSGLRGMIGKGERSVEVINAVRSTKSVYFVAIGGAGVLLANSIEKAEIIAWDELGPEAVRRLEVRNFPCIVAIDTNGNNIFEKR